jgi:glycosyltransferase involved in cell wall biosynthesis
MTVLQGARICLVTSGPIGSDPRLVKEAHALHQAGAQVRVVATNATALAHVHERDATVLRGAPWSFEAVPTGGAWARRRRALVRRAATVAWSLGWHGARVAQSALEPLIPAIARTAARQPADLYIAHNLPALTAAAWAARHHGARLGFDAEDFHSGQLRGDEQPAKAIQQAIERRHLPQCMHRTAASPGIGRAYAGAYGIPDPVTVLNVFPRALAPAAPSPHGDRVHGPSIYWFSQTIGPGRGLEEALAAIALSRSRPHLVLQGSAEPAYRHQLEGIASGLGLAGHVHFEPPAPPDELPRIASRHDLGLASEPADTPNRDACLSNKLFTYLLGGVPVLASATTGQSALAAGHPDCIWALPLDDTRAWAARLDALLLVPAALANARAAAWQAAQSRLHWELECRAFLASVADALARPAEPLR